MPVLAREAARYADVYYPAYRDKHLLVAGGIADQPARYLTILDVVRALDARTQKRLLEIERENAE
jgi:hypothetical protein